MADLEVARQIVRVLEGGDERGGRAALATVIRRSGSAPQVVGAQLMLHADGSQVGTIGGGAIEALVLERCREALVDGQPRTVGADLVRDLAMCCGGSMEVFVEVLEPSIRLVVLGAGHVSQALAPLLAPLGFRALVLDDRDELLEHPAFASAQTRPYDADELLDAVPDLGGRDYVLIVTRDHQRDEAALRQALERPHAYVGMIGSKRKVHRVLGRVLRRYDERGLARPDLSRLRAPVGLALSGRSPAEIAVSIAAELVAMRHGGSGAAMSIVEDVAARAGDPE